MTITKAILVASLLLPAATAATANEEIADKYPQSVLYDKPFEVVPNVWSAIGATAPPTYENAGHNNNLSFLVTGDGVIVINGGANYKLAEALHAEIREVTDQPVKLVINENGQGHAMLGNNYWTEQGVDILAHVDAVHEFEEYGAQILGGMQNYARENSEGTELVTPNLTFEDRYEIEMGDMRVEVLHLGPAHSAGDIQVWLPERDVMIAGDIAFNGRMPPIFTETCTSCWIETWETAFAPLNPTYIIPGHGYPTNLAQVEHHTMDYIKDLRAKIGAHLDNGGMLDDAYYVDQSKWEFLDTFDELATKNAGTVYTEMEFE